MAGNLSLEKMRLFLFLPQFSNVCIYSTEACTGLVSLRGIVNSHPHLMQVLCDRKEQNLPLFTKD